METTEQPCFPDCSSFQRPPRSSACGPLPAPITSLLTSCHIFHWDAPASPVHFTVRTLVITLGPSGNPDTLPSQVAIRLAKFLLSREVVCPKVPGVPGQVWESALFCQPEGHAQSAACVGCRTRPDLVRLHVTWLLVPVWPPEHLTAKFHDHFRRRLKASA